MELELIMPDNKGVTPDYLNTNDLKTYRGTVPDKLPDKIVGYDEDNFLTEDRSNHISIYDPWNGPIIETLNQLIDYLKDTKDAK